MIDSTLPPRNTLLAFIFVLMFSAFCFCRNGNIRVRKTGFVCRFFLHKLIP